MADKKMTKAPVQYKGDDAVELVCMREYDTLTNLPVRYKKGVRYKVSPTSAVHLLRKTYNLRENVEVVDRGMKVTVRRYIGDAHFFIDAARYDAMQKDAKKAEKAPAA